MTATRPAGRLLLVVWFVLPLIPIALWAVSNQWSFPAVLPQEWGVDGVRSAVAAGGTEAFMRSTGLALTVAAIATPLGAFAARALARGDVHFPGVVAAILFAPLALPPFAVALGLNVVILRARIPSTLAVIVLLSVAAIPYTTYLMRVAVGAYDSRYEEEARMLGASKSMVLWQIRIPLLAPALSGSALLAFLVGWSDYVITLLVGGGRLVTVPILVASFAAGTGNDAVVAALSIAAIVPPLVLIALLSRLGRRTAR
ncbi:ABC transporter permease subunit [Rhodococcus sp. PAMC28707]|uniref:ABC transporter permease n=1 Tax=unclassified Rhodococcus (in: high G+C Gram-positive bacteria) TaxID=192944 RepID=UPI00109E1565|nr:MULTISPECIES: ABC transporter permease subunit [unclassified Rhodococcus (in: high G+C Gram-positive bacteria)]QCB49289.1 ABC transporter permease subunit [Rhodococcus sp. PAMC28705]QCB59023.1 ABC transporter permease subunit [Rhodococcus sp. PAMC28707]